MNIDRRQFLKATCLTCSAVGLDLFSPFFLQRKLFAATADNEKKLIFIFQRGGNDGINTILPRGDSDYNLKNRPTLFIPEKSALDSGNGFAQLHPSLEPMMEIFNATALNGQAGPGNLAILHRIGYANQSRSHFDSQQYWENGKPGDNQLQEGLFYRQLASTRNLTDRQNSFVAASLSTSQLVSLKGKTPLPNFERASDFSFIGAASKTQKFLGALPQSADGSDGKGLLGLYGGLPDKNGKMYRQLVHETGQLLGATIHTLQTAARGAYTPANGAVYPNTSFGQKLQQAAMLLKRTPVRVLGLNLDGWDTHSGQGQLTGSQPNLLNQLAKGFQALHRDLQDQWDRLVIVTMTEFGRTSIENGSRGTDHAESSVMFVAGGPVKGGVYNCDPTTWKQGDMFSKRGRYLARRNDFRGVFAEIFTKHFGDNPPLLDRVFPGYSNAVAAAPNEFQPLGFL